MTIKDEVSTYFVNWLRNPHFWLHLEELSFSGPLKSAKDQASILKLNYC